MKIATKVMGGVLAAVVLVAPAQAQTSYFTQGFFSIPSNPTFATCNSTPFNAAVTTPLGATCGNGAFLLTYTPVEKFLIGDNSTTSLGNFTLSGAGEATVPPGTVVFTIAIRQTAPTVGDGFTDGFISGRVTTAPPTGENFSSLIWIPDQFVNINATTYELIFDNKGYAKDLGLALPSSGTRGIDALITTTPEPASMALLATGLIGVFGVARRRRSSTTV